MQTIMKVLVAVTPWLFEKICAELAPVRALTGFTLLSLVVASTAAHRVASSLSAYSLMREIRTLLTLWAMSCISILLWTTCQILLHMYQIS